MSVAKRLTNVLKKAKIVPINQNSKIVTISDCHRGTGTWADDFLNNQHLFFAALSYYYDRGFTYIELGDGDELWGNRNLDSVITAHSNAFWLMSRFYMEGRLHMIYGNHDMVKKKIRPECLKCAIECPRQKDEKSTLFPGVRFHEGIILKDLKNEKGILLVHGHQGDLMNDKFWKLSRFLVRYVWKRLELMGFRDPTSAAKNYKRKNALEQKISDWCEANDQMLIAGHTHRPAFPKPGDTPYFNDGSCVHPRCITTMEIEDGAISLVKWSVCTKPDRTMYVERVLLEGPVSLNNYLNPYV